MGSGASKLSEQRSKEVAQQILVLQAHNPDKIIDKFHRFDKAGDGTVTRAEFDQAIENLGISKPAEDEIDQLIQVSGANQTGMVNYRKAVEFIMAGGRKKRRVQFARHNQTYVSAKGKLQAKLEKQQGELREMHDSMFPKKETEEPMKQQELHFGLPLEEPGKYTKLKMLGKGVFGRVYLVRSVDDTKLHAMKQVVGVGNALKMKEDKAHPDARPDHRRSQKIASQQLENRLSRDF